MLQIKSTLFFCFIGIIFTKLIEFLYLTSVVFNNFYLYLLASVWYGDSWDDFQVWFVYHYKFFDFTFATLIVPMFIIVWLYFPQCILVLYSNFKSDGLRNTLKSLRNSLLLFYLSVLTNLAIYDALMNHQSTSVVDCAHQEQESKLRMYPKFEYFSRSMTTINEDRKRTSLSHSQSCPAFIVVPTTPSPIDTLSVTTQQSTRVPSPVHPVPVGVILESPQTSEHHHPSSKLNTRSSLNLFIVWATVYIIITGINFALQVSRGSIYFHNLAFQGILQGSYICFYMYFIR